VRLLGPELAIKILKGEHDQPVPDRAWALEFLRDFSGDDFGDDISRWESWVAENCATEAKRTALLEQYFERKGGKFIR